MTPDDPFLKQFFSRLPASSFKLFVGVLFAVQLLITMATLWPPWMTALALWLLE